MFATNFFDVEADWADQNHMEDLRHVGASSVPLYLIRNEGDFFRDMRHVQVPGIDNIEQNRPGHRGQLDQAGLLRGAPVRKAKGLGGGGRRPRGGGQVRGGLPFRARRHGPSDSRRGRRRRPPWRIRSAAIAWYVNRLGYLLSVGRPAAQVAMYYPTNSVWMGDDDSITAMERLTQQLLEHQIDFDYLDEQVLPRWERWKAAA